MIDLSKTNKELSEGILYAVKWFNDNGFDGHLTVHNTNKTEFVVGKEGTTDTFILTAARQNLKRNDIKKYMEQFGKSFALKHNIELMRLQLKYKSKPM